MQLLLTLAVTLLTLVRSMLLMTPSTRSTSANAASAGAFTSNTSAGFGALSGFALGYLLSVALGSIEIKNPFLDSNHLPLAYSWLHYSAAGLVAIVSSIAAGYLPARKAARVHPVEIIRGAT